VASRGATPSGFDHRSMGVKFVEKKEYNIKALQGFAYRVLFSKATQERERERKRGTYYIVLVYKAIGF